MQTKSDLKCPECHHKNRIKIKTSITDIDINKIIDKSIFMQTCKNCGANFYVEHEIELMGDNYYIKYTPGSDNPLDNTPKEVNRICDTYDNFKEKVLIFNDNLNDIIIEYLKNYILDNIDDEFKDKQEGIRYAYLEDNALIFNLLGLEESVKLDKNIYDNLVNKLKFKKINKCVLVDEFNYKSYLKRKL